MLTGAPTDGQLGRYAGIYREKRRKIEEGHIGSLNEGMTEYVAGIINGYAPTSDFFVDNQKIAYPDERMMLTVLANSGEEVIHPRLFLEAYFDRWQGNARVELDEALQKSFPNAPGNVFDMATTMPSGEFITRDAMDWEYPCPARLVSSKALTEVLGLPGDTVIKHVNYNSPEARKYYQHRWDVYSDGTDSYETRLSFLDEEEFFNDILRSGVADIHEVSHTIVSQGDIAYEEQETARSMIELLIKLGATKEDIYNEVKVNPEAVLNHLELFSPYAQADAQQLLEAALVFWASEGEPFSAHAYDTLVSIGLSPTEIKQALQRHLELGIDENVA